MALLNAYCTVQHVRDQLSDAGANASQERIERAINATSRAIEAFTGRRFWQDETPVARRYRPRDPEVVMVRDIATSSGLIVQTGPGDNTWPDTWTLGTDFELAPLDADADGMPFAWWQLVAIGGRQFPVHDLRPTLKTTNVGGWSQLPDEVNSASILKSTGLFKRSDAVWGVADFGEFGAVRITKRDVDVMDLLNPFVRYSTLDT